MLLRVDFLANDILELLVQDKVCDVGIGLSLSCHCRSGLVSVIVARPDYCISWEGEQPILDGFEQGFHGAARQVGAADSPYKKSITGEKIVFCQ